MAVKQIAFKNNLNAVLIYRFENGSLKCSNGETITESANSFLAQTKKGKNSLKVTEVTNKNWQAAARAHAKSLDYLTKVDTLRAERLNFDNPPQGESSEPPMEIVQKIANYEKPFWFK